MPEEPVIKPSHDGTYPRCVWCRGENWALAVIAYSMGEIPCASTGNCGRYLPEDYVTLELPGPGAAGAEDRPERSDSPRSDPTQNI